MLQEIFKRNKIRIGFSYVLLLAEFFTIAMLPLLLGKGVDSLIQQQWGDFNFWLGTCVIVLFLGIVCRRFDNRAFLSIWNIKVIETIGNLMTKRMDPTKIVSRSYMVKEYANFLEFTLPSTISCVMDIGVSTVMLWLFVPHVAFWLCVFTFLAIISSYGFAIWMNRVETQCQHIREEVNDAIIKGNTEAMSDGYTRQKNKFVLQTDIDAAGWAIVDILSHGGTSRSNCISGSRRGHGGYHHGKPGIL